MAARDQQASYPSPDGQLGQSQLDIQDIQYVCKEGGNRELHFVHREVRLEAVAATAAVVCNR